MKKIISFYNILFQIKVLYLSKNLKLVYYTNKKYWYNIDISKTKK